MNTDIMEEIDEFIMLEANTVCCAMGDVNNSFGVTLQRGEQLKKHGLTPIYYFHKDTMSLSVEAKETKNAH